MNIVMYLAGAFMLLVFVAILAFSCLPSPVVTKFVRRLGMRQ